MSDRLCLLTPTWSGDRVHFELMRASLERSALRAVRHYVVVQTEDLDLFRRYASPTVEVIPTKDVLPGDVEARRQQARRLSARFGRGGTRIFGSLARYLGRPRWVTYTGWHVQQITKLALAAASEIDNVVALDSDVLVTRHARLDDFFHPEKIVCFEQQKPAREVPAKVVNWNRQAHALLDRPYVPEAPVDAYYDTPFLFHAPSVRNMLDWLGRRYRQSWWDVLLAQPPRRWSEFGTYRMFLRCSDSAQAVDWRAPDGVRYLFDARDPEAVRSRVAEMLEDSGSHYITIHSQSSGRQLWGAEHYAPLVLPLLDRN